MKKTLQITLIHLLLLAALACRSQNLSGIVNNYYKVLGIDFSTDVIKVDNPSYLNTGQKALLIQMKGAVIDQSTPASNSNWGHISSAGNAGQWELVTVCGINGDSVIFEREIKNTYDVSGFVQLVVFPHAVQSATVTDSVFAAPWDSATGKGGVVFISVKDTLFMNDNIAASGMGLKGGTYFNYVQAPYNCSATNITAYALNKPLSGSNTGAMKGEGIARTVLNLEYGRGRLANGAGGGNNHNAGGGGGSNWGAGGQGGVRARVAFLGCVGNNPGLGGPSLSSYINGSPYRLFMGGGGGAGHGNDDLGLHGGTGGGIVFVKCNVLVGNNHTIYANGETSHRFINLSLPDTTAASSDGGGGGGAGGMVVVYANNVLNNLAVEVKGGNGAKSEQAHNNNCMGTGGGGGGGVAFFSSASLPSGVSVNAAGGIAGVRANGYAGGYCDNASYPNGSVAGSAGTSLFNLSFVELDTTVRCWAVLPVSLFVNIYAPINGYFVNLGWTVSDAYYARLFQVEKSADGRNFTAIETVNSEDRYQFSAAQPWEDNAVYYRVKAIGKNGQIVYSKVIKVNGRASYAEAEVFPNPVRDQLFVRILLKKSQPVLYTITDATGRLVEKQELRLVAGEQTLRSAQKLKPGLYHIRLTGEAFSLVRSFVYY